MADATGGEVTVPIGAARVATDLFGETSSDAEARIHAASDLTGVLILKHDALYLLTDAHGDVHPARRALGLYLRDTRVLSRYELRVNGERPVVLRTGTGVGFEGVIQLTNPELRREVVPHADRATADAPDAREMLPRHSLSIVRERVVAAAFHERIRVRSFSDVPEPVTLALRLAADHADIFEVRGFTRPRRGQQQPPADGTDGVAFGYLGLDGRLRTTHVAFSEPPLYLDEAGLRVAAFTWRLAPGEERHLEVTVRPEERIAPSEGAPAHGAVAVAAATPDLPLPPVPGSGRDRAVAAHRAWSASVSAVTTSNGFVARALARAVSDLRVLVTPGTSPGERFLAAGVPWYTCLFGRDTIITALQLLPVRPQVAIETLDVLARYQATDREDERDAEPGKILHELRTGELARTGEIPHRPYYGTVDATPLWLVLLGETHLWTGDDALVDRLWPNALACLDWIDRSGDLDGDGLVEYVRRAPGGLQNQGWKDSMDAMRHRDGRIAAGPLALVEVQGYVHAARLHLARLARRRGDTVLADAQERAAEVLRARVEERFWLDDQDAYAMALDGDKRPVDGIGSNMGHLLWSGLASPGRAARVAGRLFRSDLWSGWGIRTFASSNGGYNPLGYHTGSVWPHDNAIAAAGLARYGHHAAASRIASALLEATSHLRDARLPELFAGFDRAEAPLPVPYPVACVPQAWAAGAPFQLLGALLGLRPDAPARRLEVVAPRLPAWLPDLRIENLRVGDGVVDLGFTAGDPVDPGTASAAVQVLRRTGDLTVMVRV